VRRTTTTLVSLENKENHMDIENQPYYNLPSKYHRDLQPLKSPIRSRIAKLKDVTNIINNTNNHIAQAAAAARGQ
jgi:argininosuccinate lyase